MSVISEFNAVASSIAPGSISGRAAFARGVPMDFYTAKIAGNSGVRDYDDTDRFLCGLANVRNGKRFGRGIPERSTCNRHCLV